MADLCTSRIKLFIYLENCDKVKVHITEQLKCTSCIPITLKVLWSW